MSDLIKLKIGFYLKWPKGMFNSKGWNVIGDELLADSMVKALNTFPNISADLYAPNFLPDSRLDFMIYLNDNEPEKEFAKFHVLYMQNAYEEGSEIILKKNQEIGFDGYVFISNKLLGIHKMSGRDGLFLPFGVDTSLFYPREKCLKYKFDIAYVGNDIKGEERTMNYLYPAVKYNFGLFGNWDFSPQKPEFIIRKKIWLSFFSYLKQSSEYKKALNAIPLYKIKFSEISKGKIPQEDVPILYSSAKINLNCTHQDCVDWDVITLRTMEVLACKGFVISDRVSVAEKILKDCMVFTDGNNDLECKIDYYLTHEKERNEIAEIGYNYVVNNATVQARMKELIVFLEGIK